MAKTDLLPPITPGQILLHQFMEPMGISQSQIARDIDVPVTRVNGIVNGQRAITVDTALRLGEYFGVDPRWWLNMQMKYDIECAEDGDWPEAKARIRPLPQHHNEYRPNA